MRATTTNAAGRQVRPGATAKGVPRPFQEPGGRPMRKDLGMRLGAPGTLVGLLPVCPRPGRVVMWGEDTGKLLEELEQPRNKHGYRRAASCLAFSADGRYVGAGFFEELHVWETRTGNLIATLLDRGDLDFVSFTRDGKGLL